MPFKNLREFIKLLDQRGQLIRIKTPVSPLLEITEITDRISKAPVTQNKALLFENLPGFDIPVLINAFGSPERMSWALGVDQLDELNHNLAKIVDPRLPRGFNEMVSRGRDLWSVFKSIGPGPKKVRRAPVQGVVHTQDASLDTLPILQCWPGDGGRFITLPQVITRDPQSGARNVGMYRLQVIDSRTLLVHWQRHKGGAGHERKALEAGYTLAPHIPAAIVLGGGPASMWCASAPLPPNIDEYLLAGYLNSTPVPFVDCVSQPLEVPAQAEIVIEGYVDPNEHLPEGPFGDHTGYYTPVEPFPVFHATAVTHRKSPIYPTTIVGIPPMEDVWMGKATERLFLPLMKLFQGEIVDVNMPAEGVFHNLVIVSIKKRYPGQPRKVMYGIWGMGLMMLTKTIIVVDADVNVHDLSQVAFEVLSNYDPLRDVQIVSGPTDDLDHASIEKRFGGKMGIDATRKTDRDPGPHQPWPEEIAMTPDIKALVDRSEEHTS